jgi:hypothetical protein
MLVYEIENSKCSVCGEVASQWGIAVISLLLNGRPALLRTYS